MFIANLKLYKKLSRYRSFTLARHLQRLIPEGKDPVQVLDFGCGNMYTALELLKVRPQLHITGLDVVRDQNLTDETLAHPQLDFVQYDAQEIPFPSDQFDYVLALNTMHHTPDPEYYLSELKRVIKPDGAILMIEEMYHNRLDKAIISGHDWVLNKMKKDIPVPLNFRSNRQYLKEFNRQELKVVHVGGMRTFPFGIYVYTYKLVK